MKTPHSLNSPAAPAKARAPLWVAYAALGVTMLIWASAFVGLRLVLQELKPMTLTSLRMVIASAAMALIAALFRVKAPRPKDLLALGVAGISGFALYHMALNFGLSHVSAGQASFIIATIPTWTALLAWRFLGERIGLWGWVGIVLGLGGVGVLSLGQGLSFDVLSGSLSGSFFLGSALVLLAAICAALNITLQKRLLDRYDPLALSIHVTLLGCSPFFFHLPTVTDELKALSLKGWLVTLWLGLGPIALGYFLSNVALAILPANRSAQMMLLVPPMVAIMAWLWIDEQPSPNLWLGGLMILVGVALGARRAKPSSLPSRSPS